jgi:hypothetical protein
MLHAGYELDGLPTVPFWDVVTARTASGSTP